MKITGFILLILLVGGTATYFQFLTEKDPCTPAISPDINYAEKSQLLDLSRENARLKSKISALEDENRNLVASIRTDKPRPSSTPALSSAISSSRLDRDLAEDSRLQQLAELEARELTEHLRSFGSDPEKKFNKDLTTKFDAEPVDFAWAQEREAKLGQLFVTHDNLAKFVPEGIICKTTRCQIRIPISSIRESNEVMEGLSQALSESPELEESGILTLPDITSGFVNFYIARDKDVSLYR